MLSLTGLDDKPNKFTIGLIVDDDVPSEVIKVARKELGGYYNAKISIIKNLELPVKFKTDTINALSLIYFFENEYPVTLDKYIFLTERGIALEDNAIYSTRGLAKGEKIAVVSTLVISSETNTAEMFNDMLAKVLIHETGHLFGLNHCETDQRCVMVTSLPNPKYFYEAEKSFCPACQEKVDNKNINKKYHDFEK
jgi:predicted Zn-dependent protease